MFQSLAVVILVQVHVVQHYFQLKRQEVFVREVLVK